MLPTCLLFSAIKLKWYGGILHKQFTGNETLTVSYYILGMNWIVVWTVIFDLLASAA